MFPWAFVSCPRKGFPPPLPPYPPYHVCILLCVSFLSLLHLQRVCIHSLFSFLISSVPDTDQLACGAETSLDKQQVFKQTNSNVHSATEDKTVAHRLAPPANTLTLCLQERERANGRGVTVTVTLEDRARTRARQRPRYFGSSVRGLLPHHLPERPPPQLARPSHGQA